MASHVEQQIAARIQAQRIKVQAARQRRDDLAAARRRGLAHRHARKLKNLAEAEERRQAAAAGKLSVPADKEPSVPANERQRYDSRDKGFVPANEPLPKPIDSRERAAEAVGAQDLDQTEPRLHMAQDS